MPIALSSLIKMTGEDDILLKQILSSFSCEKDEDIEHFLRFKAVDFERLSKSRTYLLCDEEQISDSHFCLDQLRIYGYVALALKVLSVPDDYSNRKRQELDGLSGKIHGEPIKDFSCYLIGQLSKNSNYPRNSISGRDLLQVSYDVIAAAVDAVGGRYMMVECREEQRLIDFYQQNGFQEIQRSSDGNHMMVQLIRKIY